MTTITDTIWLVCGNCGADAPVSVAEFGAVGVAYCGACHTDGIDVAWHRSHADLPDSYSDDTDED